MAEDFEKNRAEYVQSLEIKVQHLQRQLKELQDQARWIPEINNVMDPNDETIRTTLSFGGKRVTTTLTYDALKKTSSTDATTAILDSFWQNLISDQFRDLVETEIVRSQRAIKGIERAGKW